MTTLRMPYLQIISALILFYFGYATEAITQTFVNKSIHYFDSRSTSFQHVDLYKGNLIIVGQIGSDSLGLTSFFVLNIDTNGIINKLNYYSDPTLSDHTLVDGVDCILLKENGNIVVSGVMASRDNLFISEIDTSGNCVFFKEFDSDYKTLYINKIIMIDGEYYCIGFAQMQNFDHNVIVLKINSQGKRLWEKAYGSENHAEGCRSAIIEQNGITILASEGFDPTPNILNDTEHWTKFIHIDTSGEVQWEWVSMMNEEGVTSGGFRKINSDYYYSTWNSFTTSPTSVELGASVTKRDSLFNIIWKKDYTNIIGPSGIRNIYQDRSCELYAVGQSFDDVLWAKAWKIDPVDGSVIWEVQDTGIYNTKFGSRNYLYDVILLPGGNVITVGNTYNPLLGHNMGMILKISQTGLIDTLCLSTNIENYLNSYGSVVVFPNPATTQLNFYLPGEYFNKKVTGKICDLFGKQYVELNLNAGYNSVNLFENNLRPGLFVWYLTDSNNIIIKQGKVLVISTY